MASLALPRENDGSGMRRRIATCKQETSPVSSDHSLTAHSDGGTGGAPTIPAVADQHVATVGRATVRVHAGGLTEADGKDATFDSVDGCPTCRLRWSNTAVTKCRASYSICDVRKHTTADDCWLLAKGSVYNVTNFVKSHPGGVNSILKHAGMVCDEDFDFHSSSAQKLWSSYKIGDFIHCDACPAKSFCVIM